MVKVIALLLPRLRKPACLSSSLLSVEKGRVQMARGSDNNKNNNKNDINKSKYEILHCLACLVKTELAKGAEGKKECGRA